MVVKTLQKSSFAVTKSAGISLIYRLLTCTAASQPLDDSSSSCVDSNLLLNDNNAKLFVHLAAILRKVKPIAIVQISPDFFSAAIRLPRKKIYVWITSRLYIPRCNMLTKFVSVVRGAGTVST